MRYALALSLILILVIWFFYTQETDVSSVGEVSKGHVARSGSDAMDHRTPSSVSKAPRIKRRWKEILQQQKQRVAVQRQVESIKKTKASDLPPEPSDEDSTDSKEVERAAVAQLDAIVKRKPKDERWAEKVNEEASLWAGNTKQPAELTSLECGDTVCRAEVFHESGKNRTAVLSELQSTPPLNNIGFVYVKDPDDPHSVFYFTKAGQPMPSLEWPQ